MRLYSSCVYNELGISVIVIMSTASRFLSLLAYAMVLCARLFAADQQTMTLDDLLQQGNEWVQENVDPQTLKSIQDQIDPEKANQLLLDLQRRFQGDYVLDIAKLKRTAEAILPILENVKSTRPYAAWLRTRLDYFEVAENLRLIVPPPPKPEPGQPPKPAPNPKPEMQRQAWTKEMAQKPKPKGSQQYADRLKPKFTANGVPDEMIWLAEVESSFNPEARSPVGAAGLFQLMPATAKSLGLSLQPKDERLDPDKSAAAAARYLRYLYGKFHDWRLVCAAYNAGEGKVRTLLDKRKARTFDQIATALPAETQMYVPKIEAVIAKREGVAMAKLPPAKL